MRQQIPPGHLNICPTKNEACRICEKIGHFAKLCRPEMPPSPTYRPQHKHQQNSTGTQPQQRYNQLAQRQTQQKIRNINEEKQTDDQTEVEETIEPESTCYIREIMGDRQNINLIKSVNFTNEKVSEINKIRRGEFWIKTRTNNQQVFWLADTGTPRSSPTPEQINRRVQMLQQKQNRSNWNNPSGYHIWLIQRKKLHNTSGEQ